MHEIFISYSSKHRGLTRELAAVLEEQYGTGSVWWDKELEARAAYATQIRAALEQSRVVVVIWTAGAMVSDYVYAEAQRALESGKLVNIRPADISFRDIPEPFNIHHIDNAEDQDRILATVAKVWSGTPIPTRVPLHEIYFRQHGHRLIDPKQQKLPRDLREISPSELLQAKYAVVPYADLTGMAAELETWCTGFPRPASGRLLHGPGGLGKTRLLIHVAAKLCEQGWLAGFLDRPDDLDEAIRKQRWQALEQLVDYGDDAGLLLVLDYAEARQDELVRLARRLAERPEADVRPIRLVLLARSAGEWYGRLVEEQPELDRIMRGAEGHPDITELPVIPRPEQRRSLFAAARNAFAPLLAAQGYVAPAGDPSADRLHRLATNDDYERPLAVQMEALLWLVSAAPGAGSTGVDKLLDRVLGLERTHWRRLLGTLGERDVLDIARGVGQVTLVQGVESRTAAERLLMADTFDDKRTSRADVDPVVRRLKQLYGRAGGRVAQLEPDLIGEHHVAGDDVGDAELLSGCLAWINQQTEELRPKHRRDLLTVLQRATQPEHGAKAVGRAEVLLDIVIKCYTRTFATELIAVITETTGSLVRLLNEAVGVMGEDELVAIADDLPFYSLVLADLSLTINTRLTDLARVRVSAISTSAEPSAPQREAELQQLAVRTHMLGVRLANLGRREEALAASQEAVEFHRQLAAVRPEAFLPGLAVSLTSLGPRFSSVGRREEALAASREAVELHRQLAAAEPNQFLHHLAGSLGNLGVHLSNLGRWDEALTASQQAAELHRQLAVRRPDAFLRELAMSLSSLGIRFSNLGRREEALAASQQAVELYRQLAAARPDAFLPELAMSLSNLGIRFSNLGLWEEALATSQQAVELYRQLAAARPEAFLPNLATSLNNQSGHFSSLGLWEEALATSQQAVELYRQLAAARPETFLPNLATGLNNQSGVLANLGRQEEALATSQHAVELYRQLAAARPEAFLPELARSLSNLGNGYSNLGRREEALAASQQAVDIFRQLAAAWPDAFLPDLATGFSVLSDAFAALNRREEAARVAAAALEVIAPLAERYPDRHGKLARSIGADVLNYSEAAGVDADWVLLERVVRALGGDARDA